MTRRLVDTHVALWWLADDHRLTPGAREVLADPAVTLLLSAASLWEIAIKRRLGKLDAPDDLPEILRSEGFETLAVTGAHAWEVSGLPLHHGDPFDRLLIAQAAVEDVPIVTADPAFGSYAVTVEW